MRYISTRDNHPPVSAARAIHLGMVPCGGLFVPETLPRLELDISRSVPYQTTAHAVLDPLLEGFTKDDIGRCIDRAYNADTFDVPLVVQVASLDSSRHIMELWHGPTAAFKDVALQIMPYFMDVAKRTVGVDAHTVILVATSGDTGKAALEGFRNCPGISIVVFYPENGVSEVQRLQMVTTEGDNTFVVSVHGNFDDCQTGVKELFADTVFAEQLAAHGYVLSSANSINWGRLSPQIVYYVHAYSQLAAQGRIEHGAPVDFCVPTGNFGNILAGYYARAMGVPIRRLICASNVNHVLTDFFTDGIYDRNREFHRTMSPSMDILISSNLERFLFEVTGHDARRIEQWYHELATEGRFEVDQDTRAHMAEVITPGWVSEDSVLRAIGETFRRTGYVLDTHTAVAVAVSEEVDDGAVPVIIDATANPYKFSGNVLRGLSGESEPDEFQAIQRLHQVSGMPVHRAVAGLRNKDIRHDTVIDITDMRRIVYDILGIQA